MSTTTTTATSTCAGCGESFAPDKLNLTERGEVCDLCMVGGGGVDEALLGDIAFARGKRCLTGAGVAALAATFVSLRSTSSGSHSSSLTGKTETWTKASLDPAGAIGGGLAVVLALVGVITVLRARREAELEAGAFNRRKLVMIALLIVVGAYGAWRFVDSMPYEHHEVSARSELAR